MIKQYNESDYNLQLVITMCISFHEGAWKKTEKIP